MFWWPMRPLYSVLVMKCVCVWGSGGGVNSLKCNLDKAEMLITSKADYMRGDMQAVGNRVHFYLQFSFAVWRTSETSTAHVMVVLVVKGAIYFFRLVKNWSKF